MLTHLDICGTEIGEDGLEGLIAAIELPCSLKTLAVSPSLFVEEDGLKEAAIQRVVRALQHQNACLENVAVLDLVEGGSGPTGMVLKSNIELESNFAPFTTINWAGRRLLSGNHVVPAGLWPHVLGRLSEVADLVN